MRATALRVLAFLFCRDSKQTRRVHRGKFFRAILQTEVKGQPLSHRLVTHQLITDGSTVSGGQVNTVAAF